MKIKTALLTHAYTDHDIIITKAFFLGYTAEAVNKAIDEHIFKKAVTLGYTLQAIKNTKITNRQTSVKHPINHWVFLFL